MLNAKKKIANKINELDQMLNDLDSLETSNTDIDDSKPKIDIDGLDVVDVLHNLLH